MTRASSGNNRQYINQFTTKEQTMFIAQPSRAMMIGLVLFAATANAQTTQRNTINPELVDKVRDAVMKELRDSGAMDRAVDAGVDRYVQKQRAEAAQREQREAGTRSAAMRPVSKDRDHIRGNPAAPVTLVEYSDFECPFCKRFHSTVKQLVDESNGQLKWVYRHFPIDELHPAKARKEAAASECAAELGGNDAFWKFADRFYELTPSNNRTDIDKVLPQIAREIGLDSGKFASCLASGRHDQRVNEDQQNAVATGGRGTPWSIIVSKGGKMYPLSGAQPYATIKQIIELALQEK